MCCAVLCCVCCAVSALLANCGHSLGSCCAVSAAPSLLCASWGVHVMNACVRLPDSLSVAGCKGAAIAKFWAAFSWEISPGSCGCGGVVLGLCCAVLCCVCCAVFALWVSCGHHLGFCCAVLCLVRRAVLCCVCCAVSALCVLGGGMWFVRVCVCGAAFFLSQLSPKF